MVVVACTYFFTEKMPAIQYQEFIDFSNAILDEKNDFTYELLDRQRDLAQFTLENSLENRTYSDGDFLACYARKLDEQIDETDIDFFCAKLLF